MDTNSFIVCKKQMIFNKDIVQDVETTFDTSNYELDKPLSKGKNEKKIELMKNELGRKIKTKFVGLRAKTSSLLIDYGNRT